MTEVVTGEAVALDLRTAALPSRVVAALADGRRVRVDVVDTDF